MGHRGCEYAENTMNPENRSESDALPNLGVNPGYVLGQLAKALQTSQTDTDPATRERANRKIAKWVSVYEGLLSGSLRVGSRTPVSDTPAWAMLEVAHGGFARSLLASGPLQSHEHARLSRLPAVLEGTNGLPLTRRISPTKGWPNSDNSSIRAAIA